MAQGKKYRHKQFLQDVVLFRFSSPTKTPDTVRSTSLLLIALVVFAQTATAQESVPFKAVVPKTESHVAAKQAEVTLIHVTDRLHASPEGQAALQEYRDARDAGLLPAGKAGAAYEIGQEKEFNVLTAVATNNATWKTIGFTLRAENEVANVWVDTSLEGSIEQAQLDEVEAAILSATPSGSYRPERGIVENDNDTFGNPPDVDGDGKVDILMFDIFEGGDGGCCVLGFVTSVDLDPTPESGRGNGADVLYVDLPDGIQNGVSTMGWVISHEYQHLIHYNYDLNELSFVNEGQSEWASVINGYFNRSIRYLSNASEHSTKLLDWRDDQGTNVVDNDYQRAGLFTTYLAERIGLEATGSITRAVSSSGSPAVGRVGYDVVLAEHSLTLDEIVGDFHVANFLNDKSVDSKYGYTASARQVLPRVATETVDGTSRSVWDKVNLQISGGAFRYITWNVVADFGITVDVNSQVPAVFKDSDRARTSVHLVAEHTSGVFEVLEVAAGEEFTASGDFDRVTAVIANTNPLDSRQLQLDVESSWSSAGGSGISRQTVTYDDGTAATTGLTLEDGSFARFLIIGEEAVQASRFTVPTGSRLSKIYLAPIYDNQFGDSEVPDGAPRDFRLHLWADDGLGGPGEELYSATVTDSPTGTHLNFSNMQYLFLEHTLPSDNSLFSELPSPVYIGMSNAGTDPNILVMTVSAHSGDEVSFLNLPVFSGWAALGDIFTAASGDTTFVFENRALPIRAEFIVSTASEVDDELPNAISLDQNYPNPFNPASSISYSLPRSMHVRLSVYDALGRQVATLVDGIESAGVHQAAVDATGWASGVYMYALQTEASTVTRKMIVLK